MKPVISIVVPVYKTEKFITQCLNSLINQTLKEIEIIVVNDGSPDGAGEICEKFSKKDERVKVYHQKNLGGCVAMWNGAHYARASYIMYLDGDDWIDLNTCEIAYDAITQSGSDVVFWTYIKEYSNGTSRKVTPIFKSFRLFRNEDIDFLKRRFFGLIDEELRNTSETDAISSCWGKLYKRELILNDQWCMIDVNGNHNFDALINIRLFKNVKKAVFLYEFFNHYRQYNSNSATKTHELNLLNKYLVFFENIQLFINENNLDNSYQVALNNRIALSVINNALSVTNPQLKRTTPERINQLKKVLNHDTYVAALNKLNVKFLPLHWRLYFMLGRRKKVVLLYILTLLIRKLR